MGNAGCLVFIVIIWAAMFVYFLAKRLNIKAKLDIKPRTGPEPARGESEPVARQATPPQQPPAAEPGPARGESAPARGEPAPARGEVAPSPTPRPTPPASQPARPQLQAGPAAGHRDSLTGPPADMAETAEPALDENADLERRLKAMDRPILDDGVDIDKLLRDMDKPSTP